MGKRASSVKVYNQQKKIEVTDLPEKIISAIENTLRKLKPQEVFNFSVVLTDSKEIKNLNQRYRKVNAVTDVLAFPYSPHEADIFISVEQAFTQAKEYKQTLKEEVVRLAIHGILHCLGWRDAKEKERKRMWAIQEKILREFFSRNKNC